MAGSAESPAEAGAAPAGGVADQTPGLMPDLLWDDVAAPFKIDGSVKLVYVEAAGSMQIWQALADWVCARGPDRSVQLPTPRRRVEGNGNPR